MINTHGSLDGISNSNLFRLAGLLTASISGLFILFCLLVQHGSCSIIVGLQLLLFTALLIIGLIVFLIGQIMVWLKR